MKKKVFILVVLIAAIFTYNAFGAQSTDWVLPLSKVTPGVTNSNVNQNNIKSTICVSGWTATIRPPATYTTKLKKQQMAGDYKYLLSQYGTDTSKYEEDHLISLELGGNPTDPKNLWPEPWDGNNAHMKDVVETKLKKLVCSGSIKLVDAQQMIAKNWVVAYNKYK